MATVRRRLREFFRGPVTVVGSATFAGSGQVTFSGIVSQVGSLVRTGFATVNAPTRINTPVITPAGSANNQIAGFTRLNSGAASVTVSTTVVKSNALFVLGAPILAAVIPTAHQASGSIPGGIVVNTITEASFFTLGWAGGVGYGAPVDIPWKIELQA